MNLKGNTILITGGATGIGYALVTRFLKAGNQVIICGRRADKLAEVKAVHPEIATYTCDLSREEDRTHLFQQVLRDFPEVNVLINNAGIQRFPKYNTKEAWLDSASEIETNLAAPIHLTMLFADHLLQRENAAIMNVTSGLSHVPLAIVPIYSATKAALHSYTLSLRSQLAGQPIRVIELSPPLTDTDLGLAGANTAGISVDEFADEVIRGLANGEEEITYGWSKLTAGASRPERDEIFKNLNGSAHH